MMKKRFVFSMLFFLLVINIFNSVSSAHEVYNPPIRWIDVGTYESWFSKHNQVQIKCFGGVLDSNYTNAYGNSKSSWNNNSNNYVSITEGPYSFPETRCSIYSHIWDSSWPSTWAAKNSMEFKTSDYKIFRSTINLNDKEMKNWTETDKQKTITHEFGHCFGFGDTNDGTKSIMKNGKGSDIGYYKPQSHDKSDLKNFYK